MQSRIFRKAALERLSSPEQLDQLMQITSPRSWLVLFGLAALTVVAVVWAFVGSIPTTVSGQGILIRGGEIGSISATAAGQLSDIYVDVGGVVEEGQVIARILDEITSENVPVVSAVSGRILEIHAEPQSAVRVGDLLISLEPTGLEVIGLQAIIYLPATEGKKVRPGMQVQIAPTTVRAEETGVLLGWVTRVGEFPSSAAGMLRLLKNNDLVQRFFSLTGGAPIEVRVDLVPSRETLSGYKWSSPQGAGVEVESGTLFEADIVLDRRRPIDLIIPGLGG